MTTLLPTTTLAAAVTGSLSDVVTIENVTAVTLTAKCVRVGGGTTAKFWVQTSIDGDVWSDVANFAFTTTSLNKAAAVTMSVAHTHATIIDGTLADNSVLAGRLGNQFRVKYTTTGTYTGASTIEINANFKVSGRH